MNCNAKSLRVLIDRFGIEIYYSLMMAQPTKFLISIFNEGKLFLIQTTLRECVLFLEAKNMVTAC